MTKSKYNQDGSSSDEEQKIDPTLTRPAPKDVINKDLIYDIIISGLDPTLDEPNLVAIFEGCSDVFICRNNTGQSIGTVLMKLADKQGIENALQIANNMNSQDIVPTRINLTQNNLLVYNIEPTVSNQSLSVLFSSYGPIDLFQPPRDQKNNVSLYFQ